MGSQIIVGLSESTLKQKVCVFKLPSGNGKSYVALITAKYYL